MSKSIRTFFLLLVFFSACLIQSTSGQTTTLEFSTQYCSTQLGSSSIKPVPRTTSAFITHSHTTVFSTVTPSTTTTPPTYTSTSTSTTTTTTTSIASQLTDTAYSTTTFTSTSVVSTTITGTSTTTSTFTTTEAIASTTIAEAAGFTAIANEPAIMSAGGGSKRKRTLTGRPLVDLPAKSNGKRYSSSELSLPRAPKAVPETNEKLAVKSKSTSSGPYPTQVICSKTVSYITVTTKTITGATTTIAAPTPTATTTITTTTTATSTSYPADASTTSTISTTTTITSSTTFSATVTTTLTASTTVYSAAATYYAVCQDPKNFITEVGGVPIDSAHTPGGYGSTTTDNAADCCVACQAMAGCGVSAWVTDGSNLCYLISDQTCDPTQGVAELYTANGYTPYSVSNGNCGQYSGVEHDPN